MGITKHRSTFSTALVLDNKVLHSYHMVTLFVYVRICVSLSSPVFIAWSDVGSVRNLRLRSESFGVYGVLLLAKSRSLNYRIEKR